MADGEVVIDTSLDPSGFKKGLSKLGSLAASGLKVTTAAIGAVSTALTTLTGAIIKMGSEYEAQLSRVQAISGATAVEMEALDKLAMQLGKDTAFSATESAAGMENLASAGFTVNEIMSAMPGLLDLAAVSGGDVAAASEVAASTIRAFGMEASNAGHVANVFARAAADTNAEVQDMGEAMKYVAPIASAMGLSLEETAAAIGIMSDAGVQGSQAGTALRGALSRLANATKPMKETMDALGISFYDSQGNMLSLSEQVTVLRDALSGLTQEQRDEALVTLYGQEALTGMLALIESGPEKLDTLTDSLINSSGAAEEMADIMLDNLNGAIENLSGSLETLGLSVYKSFQEPLKEAVNEANGLIEDLQSAFDAGGFDGLVSAVGSVLAQVVTQIVSYAPQLVQASTSIITSLLTGITDNADVLASAAIDLVKVLASGIADISVSLVESGLQLVTSLLRGIRDGGTDGIGEAALDIITRLIAAFSQSLPEITSIGFDIVTELITALTQALPEIATIGSDILTNLASGVASGTKDFVSQALPLITDFTANLRSSAGQLVDAGIELIINLMAGLVAALPDLIAYIPQIVINIAGIINDNAPKLLACAITLIGQLIQGIISAIPDLIANAGKIVEAILAVIQAVNWLSLGTSIMNMLKNGISSMVGSLGEAAKAIGNKINSTIQNIDWVELGKTIFTFLKNGITSMTNLVGSAAKAVAQNGFDLIRNIDWLGLGRTVLTFVINGIQALGSTLLSALKTIGTSALNAFKAIDWTNLGSTVINFIKNGIQSVASGIMNALKTAGTNALNSFKNVDWVGVGKQVINGIIAGITGAASALYNSLKSLASSALSAAKRALGINSPSRVFRDQIGKFISLGLADGISGDASAAVQAVQDMADDIASVKFKYPGSDKQIQLDGPDNPNVSALVAKMKSGINKEVGNITSDVTIRTKSGSGQVDSIADEGFDYDRMGDAVAQGFIRADVKMECDDREFGRLVSDHTPK